MPIQAIQDENTYTKKFVNDGGRGAVPYWGHWKKPTLVSRLNELHLQCIDKNTPLALYCTAHS